MIKIVALAAALSACAHPRGAIASGAGLMVLGIVAESANSTTYCSDNCLGTQIGDGIGNGLAHATGTILIVGGIVAVVGGLVGLSNEH